MRPPDLPNTITALKDMSPTAAVTTVSRSILHVFATDPGEVTEIMVTPVVELRVERTETGVTLELNDVEFLSQLWRKDYQNAKWATRGAINRIIEARLGVTFEGDFLRRGRKALSSAGNDVSGTSHGSIWREIPVAYRYETDVISARDKITVSVSTFEDGTADATFNWLGSVFHHSFDSLWDAKSSSLKIASSLLEWKGPAAPAA